MTWTTDDWTGCYPSNWKGIITPEAIAHPAKFSSRLIRRIYAHLSEEGWVKAGDTIVDPFGGVALGAFDAMRNGLNWVGVELEPRFVDMGNANILLWRNRYTWWKGTAQLLRGDSRHLLDVIKSATSMVSSPPYSRSLDDGHPKNKRTDGTFFTYGFDTPGQLGAMKSGDFDAVISSPPFRAQTGGSNQTNSTGPLADKGIIARHAAGNRAIGYGETPGDISKLPDGDFDAALSSPPYKNDPFTPGIDMSKTPSRKPEWNNKVVQDRLDQQAQGYGETEGQLVNAEDFWSAARAIVEQVYLALAPGGHAVWVCKDFVKNKARVPFCDQWRQLCEAVGFVTVHEHHALLVRSKGTSITLDGEHIKHTVESKSFFRRLAENKGSPRIDWETIWCMEKPR